MEVMRTLKDHQFLLGYCLHSLLHFVSGYVS